VGDLGLIQNIPDGTAAALRMEMRSMKLQKQLLNNWLSHKIVIGFCLLLILSLSGTNLARASSRGSSFSSRKLGLISLNQVKTDDFFLRYLKELYAELNNTYSPTQNSMLDGDRGFFEWVPDGAIISAVPAECLPEAFEGQALESLLTSAAYAQRVKSYFDHCGPYLSARATGGLMGLIDFAMASYPFLDNSRIRPIVFQTPDGRKLNGFIGIKDDSPRPWVIYKCGVFCAAEADGASIKNYVMHLFDQSPFNVIVLGNRTGYDYIVPNRVFSFGGSYESQDFIDVARWLREQSNYRNLVSSVHVVAVSLAGSAAFLTERRLSGVGSQRADLIQSVSSLCAVSDLRSTVEDMYGDSLKGSIFSRLTWNYLQAAKFALPEAEDLLNNDRPETQEFPDFLGQLTARFMPKAEDSKTEEEWLKDFWDKNRYTTTPNQSRVPLFVWASEDDSVVSYQLNTGKLIKPSEHSINPNVGIVGLASGEHCGFATAYGYPVASSILRTFILNNSPEYSVQSNQQVLGLNVNLPSMIAGERIIASWWSQSQRTPWALSLNFEIYGADDSLCPEELEFAGASNCRRVASLEVSGDLFSGLGFLPPKNQVEFEALVRELNARMSIYRDGRSIVGQTSWPNQLVVRF
jgi:hypothetical protein